MNSTLTHENGKLVDLDISSVNKMLVSPDIANQNGISMLQKRNAIYGDKILGTLLLGAYMRKYPQATSGDVGSFISRYASADELCKLAKLLGVSAAASVESRSSSVQTEIFESAIGYYAWKNGLVKTLEWILPLVTYYVDSISVIPEDRYGSLL